MNDKTGVIYLKIAVYLDSDVDTESGIVEDFVENLDYDIISHTDGVSISHTEIKDSGRNYQINKTRMK